MKVDFSPQEDLVEFIVQSVISNSNRDGSIVRVDSICHIELIRNIKVHSIIQSLRLLEELQNENHELDVHHTLDDWIDELKIKINE
jgi:hypothetical protein